MKATGVIRRVDQLGRIVVPKEIRKTLRIGEGDQIEIFVNREKEIILKKYSQIESLSQIAGKCADSLGQVTGHIAIVTDKNKVIAVCGSRKDMQDKPISRELEDKINRKENIRAVKGDKNYVEVSPDIETAPVEVIAPIICEGDPIGAVIILPKGNALVGEKEESLAKCTAAILGKQMEN
ncbi:MAG: stage V sporulation T C-terminal domain-containing protein [Lachnospiraceae bacterium]